MPNYLVWDSLNEDREDAKRIEAEDAKAAAIGFAEGDECGRTDGVYMQHGEAMSSVREHGQPLIVEDESGTRKTFLVGIVEFEPVFAAEEE